MNFDEEDHVAAAIERARRRPPMPEAERRRLLALAKQATGPWLSNTEFMERLARLRRDEAERARSEEGGVAP